MSLIRPHGGTLVSRFAVDPAALSQHLASLPRITLDARELADLELLAVGAASPLTGFLCEADYTCVVESMRLSSGLVWPLPLTLAVDAKPTSSQLALCDASGRPWARLDVESVFERDPLHEARHVYGTEDAAHPGVAYLLSRPRILVGGHVEVLPLPELPFAQFRLTPAQTRAEIERRGFKTVAAFQTRNPIHRAHEHLTKLALELCDGLLLHPLVGETKQDDVPASVRFEIYETLVERYYPPARTMLAAFPAAMRYAGPREAIFHALVRKNYGATHLIVGRDHAGVGTYYPATAAQELFERFTPEELGVVPLKFEPTFYCKVCEAIASSRSCPHDKSARLELSGTKVRELLRAGEPLPREFTRPEVAEILRRHFGGAPAAAPARAPGFIVWFTGLSGAGKSTLARALEVALRSQAHVEVLDGDEVRTYLSKGLGFSKADRDTNIRRIGFVARALARSGAIAIGAAISPYAEVRDEVRRLAKADGVELVEVHVTAALEALVARDSKGLYAQALAGTLANFTGVNDPYEAPVSPELRLETDRETPAQSLAKILELLRARGLSR
jgi:sulfate adenylyltransferase